MPRWRSSALDAAHVERGSTAGGDPFDGPAVDLDLADSCLAPAGQQAQRHSPLDRAAAERPGDDRAATLDAEDSVDREPGGAAGQTPGEDAIDERDERRPELVEARPCGRGDDDDRGAGEDRSVEQVTRGGGHFGCPLRCHGVGLRDDRQAIGDAERVEQLEVLERLRPRSVVGRDDEECGVDLARPDEHVSNELVVPRDVDEVELRAVRQIEVGVADVDRHPPPPLLGQTIGIDPRQRAEQRRLAVVDVARGPDDDGHDGSAAPRLR